MQYISWCIYLQLVHSHVCFSFSVYCVCVCGTGITYLCIWTGFRIFGEDYWIIARYFVSVFSFLFFYFFFQFKNIPKCILYFCQAFLCIPVCWLAYNLFVICVLFRNLAINLVDVYHLLARQKSQNWSYLNTIFYYSKICCSQLYIIVVFVCMYVEVVQN